MGSNFGTSWTEDRCNFDRIWRPIRFSGSYCNKGFDRESARGDVQRMELANHRRGFDLNTHFLVKFSKPCGLEIEIEGLALATGNGHLA
jgi:hypothetical protein